MNIEFYLTVGNVYFPEVCFSSCVSPSLADFFILKQIWTLYARSWEWKTQQNTHVNIVINATSASVKGVTILISSQM